MATGQDSFLGLQRGYDAKFHKGGAEARGFFILLCKMLNLC